MNKEAFVFLRSYSYVPEKINRLIVSSFLHGHGIRAVKNVHLNGLLILETDDDFKELTNFLEIQSLSSFEQLIELFEFVVSPENKIVNGAIYTPKYIREYIVERSFGTSLTNLNEVSICDPACGCAGFLFTVSKYLKKQTTKTYKEIFATQIFGLDIEEYSVERSKLLLTLLAVSEGEDEESFDFNFHTGNALNFNWGEHLPEHEGFDIIVGNPPYVCSRNMDQESLDLMDKWVVAQSGHPDLYIPFFQIGYENLKPNGVLGLITVNTFIRSINGRSLREYFSNHEVDLTIINFGGEQVFRNRSTYTCICFLQNTGGGVVRYTRTLSTELDDLTATDFIDFQYSNLQNHDGWSLVDSVEQTAYINQIESIGQPLKRKHVTRNGIATLKNDVYKFFPVNESEEYYTLITKSGAEYKIEKGICRDIVNPNKVRSIEEIDLNSEKIIFPYQRLDGQTLILEEAVFIDQYPNTYNYLSDFREVLSKRDKGKKVYERWYAYGRRQSLDINAYKLFFPHLSERPSFTISEDLDLLFYSGIAIVSDTLRELQVLKRIMESDVFFDYIKSITKDYSSGYISMSKNYIKNFGIPDLTEEEGEELLHSENPEELIRFFYNLSE